MTAIMKILLITALCFACASASPERIRRDLPPPKDGDVSKLFDGDAPQTTEFDGDSLFDENGDVVGDKASMFDQVQTEALKDMHNQTWFNFTHVDPRRMFEVIKRFADMPPEIKMSFGGLLVDQDVVTRITAKDMEAIPIELFLVLKKPLLIGLKTKLTADFQKSVCGRAKYIDERGLKKLAHIFECFDRIADGPVDEDQAASMIDVLLEKYGDNVQVWTADVWTKALPFLSGLPTEMLTKMPADLVRANLDKLGPLMENSDDIVDKIRTDLNGFDKLTDIELRKLGRFVGKLPISDLGRIPPEAMKGALADLASGREFLSKAKRHEVFKQLLMAFNITHETIEIPDSVTPEEISQMLQMNPNSKEFLKKIPPSKMGAVATAMGHVHLDKGERIVLVAELRKTELRNFDSWDASKMKSMKSLMAGMSKSEFDLIPENERKLAFDDGDFKDIDFPDEMARDIVKKARPQSGSITAANLKKMGSSIRALSASDVKGMDNSAVLDPEVLQLMAKEKDRMETVAKKEVFDKIRQSGDIKGNIFNLKEMISDAPIDVVEALTGQDIMDEANTSPGSIQCGSIVCQVMFKKVKVILGTPGQTNPNFNVENVRKLGSVMCGIKLSDIRKIPSDDQFPELLGLFVKLPCLNQKQARLLALKAMAHFKFDTAETVNITPEQIKDFGGRLLKYLSPSTLRKFPQNMCKAVLMQQAEADYSDVSRNDVDGIVKYALETCLNKASGALSEGNIQSLGNMACFLPTDRVNEITTKKGVDLLTSLMEGCPQLSQENLKKRKEQFLSANQITDYSQIDDAMLSLGGQLLAVDCSTDTKLDNIADASMAAEMIGIEERVEDIREKERKRKEEGNEKDITDADRSAFMANSKCMIQKGLTARINQRDVPARRKRTTESVTCDDIKSMGNLASALTDVQISGIDNAELTNCITELGAVTDWTSTQKTALIAKAVTAWGAINTWSKEEQLSLGTMAHGLTTAQIDTLTNFDIDVLSKMGSIKGWSAEQLTAGFNKWFAGREHNTLTGVELSAMGHFACGIDTTGIGNIASANYKLASQDIGLAEPCTVAQKEAYVAKAKDVFGSDVTLWDQYTVKALGATIGGLPGADLAKLSEEQLSNIDNVVISTLPSASLGGLTVEQIGFLSPAQANSFTTDQKSALSQAVKEAIDGAAAVVTTTVGVGDGTGNNSGAPDSKKMSAVVVGLMMLISLSFIRRV